MNTRLSQLAEKFLLFADLSDAERAELISASNVKQVKKGELVFHHGDESRSFYIVGSGAIRVHRQTPEGKDITLQIAIVGDTLGDHEMFENKSSYQASAIAAEDSVLLEYPVAWIKEKIREHSGLALNMLAAISKSGSRIAIDREHMVTLKTPQRLACFMLRLCDLHELNPQRFTLPYSKSTIASKLGMEPESFSRALARLKEIGLEVSGNEIRIRDITQLNDYACSACSVSEDCETCDYTHAHTASGGSGKIGA